MSTDRLGEWLYHLFHRQAGQQFQKGCWVCEMKDHRASKGGSETGKPGRPRKAIATK